MDFNDDRSIFSNSQMALDINMSQNDYITNYDDSHMMPYFMNDGSNFSTILNVSNACEPNQQQPPQNVLCSSQQSSNSLKAQNQPIHQHPSQASIQNSNRSRNLNQHHTYQPPQSHSFHNQAQPTSKQFLPNIAQINQQQINYVNIPNKDKSMIYSSEVVNQHNMLNSSNCVYNKEETLYHDNSMLKDNSFHNNGINNQSQIQHQQRLPPAQPNNLNMLQQQNSDLIIKSNNNVLHKNQSFANNLSPNSLPSIAIKNGTSSLLSPVHNQEFYHSPPPSGNYYNTQSTQQPLFIQEKKQMNGAITSGNYFNETSNLTTTSPIEQSIQSNVDTRMQAEQISINNLMNSNNSILTANKNSPTNKSQTSELKNSLTVDQTTQKAETRTIFIVKIIDQVVLNGKVVKETIIKNDEIIKQTGHIDWPEQPSKSPLPTSLTKSTETKSTKKTTPKSKSLKRAVNHDSQTNERLKDKQQQEKKMKTEDLTQVDTPKDDSLEKVEPTSDVDQTLSRKQIQPKKEPITSAKQEKTELIEKDNPVVSSSNPTKHQARNDMLIDESANSSFDTCKTDVTSEQPTAQNYHVEDPVFRPSIDVNQKVLSRWTDKNYYPGKVLIRENDSRWRIGFDDGGRRLVRENEIISIEFIPRGQQVMVNYANGFVAKGVIKSHRLDPANSQIYYLIEYLIGLKCVETEYNAKDVFLTGENAISLLNRRKPNINNSKFADVDLNNIIPAHRRSRIRDTNKNDAPSLNSSTNDSKTTLTSELEMMDNDSNSNLSTSTANSSATNSSATKKSSKKGKQIVSGKQQPGVSLNEDTESSVIVGNNSKSNSSDVDLKCEVKNDELFIYDDLIGPLPTNDIFKRFAFLLSFDDEKPNSDSAGYSIPFDIEHLTKQIQSGSGLIIDKLEDTKDNNYQVVLVSHSYHQSVKYMMCLSSGIPCIKFTWIIDSCKKNELLKKEDYILPSGFSILTNNLLQDRTIYKKSPTLFKGTRIYLISSPTNSELNKWLPLFNASKAILFDFLPDTRKSGSDLIVSDSTCSNEIIEKASNLKIPIVSINYIIECLIQGKRLNTDHPIFHHNYSSSSK